MAEERIQRRLAAILAADVVGYSRLMQLDEAGTLAVLKARRTQILQPTVSRHQGRIVKLMGDGVLVEFSSAVNAVECAVQLQVAMKGANADLPEDKRITLRIGINLGDVLVEGGDLYGDGVNIAARLEALADSGCVFVSQTVFSHVKGKSKLEFEDLGEQILKNILEPVRVFRVSAVGVGTNRALPGLAVQSKPSIAVLPFTNIGGDPEQEYFADGMVEDIITALSRFGGLFVIARNSSFTYKGRAVDVKHVGRELGVRYVLEGSVRKAAGQVRITGQLIDAMTGAHIWADRYDGNLGDIFALQDRVTTSVVGAIAPKMEQAEIERAKRKPTESLDAYDYYLRALAIANQMTREASDEALRLFGCAITRDPAFALAMARMSHCYTYRKANGWMHDRVHETEEAERLARHAAERGRDDAVALCYSAITLGYLAGALDDGAAFVARSLALNSNLADAWFASGFIRLCLGESDVAIDHSARAMRLSPFDPSMFMWQADTALAHLCASRYEDAAAWAEKALYEKPNFAYTLRVAAASHALAGHHSEAQRVMAQLCELDPLLRLSNLGDVISPLRPEDRTKYIDGLRKAGLPE
jgi:TolB-like protein/class 3 adenylate cyclase